MRHDFAVDHLVIDARRLHAESFRHPDGTMIRRTDLRNHTGNAQFPERILQTRLSSFRGIAFAPLFPLQHPSDSGMDFSFDLLRKNSELPDVFSGGPVERQPVAEAEIPIADAVPVDPLPHLVVGEGAFPGFHDLGILKHGAEQGKVLLCHFPQDQPGGFCDDPAARDGW